MSISIPGLGEVTKDESSDWLYSTEMKAMILGGRTCRIVVEGYEEDTAKEDFHIAIRNFLSAPESVLKEAEAFIYRYYQDANSIWAPEDEEYLVVATPQEIWNHISLGNEPVVSRRHYGDNAVYVSLECNCDWEPEHGLQIVFKNGLKVNKVGPFNGHLTNSDAYGDESLESVVYHHIG